MITDYDKVTVFHVFGLPINWTIVSTWVVMALLLLVSWLATRGLKSELKVSRWQTALEVIVGGIRGQVREMTKDEPMKYIPLAGTLFLFIALCNILSIIPWFKVPTTSLSTTGAFAFVVLMGVPFYGIKNAGVKGYLKKYTEPTIILMPLNILSDITSTLAMAVRLFGNMLSGSLIGMILLMLVPFIVPLPMQMLGLFTGFIQAYIFGLLTVVYLSAVSPAVDEDEFAQTQKAEDNLVETIEKSWKQDV